MPGGEARRADSLSRLQVPGELVVEAVQIAELSVFFLCSTVP